jgi:acetyltransferase-like isoleucine patch superfamily enzyme
MNSFVANIKYFLHRLQNRLYTPKPKFLGKNLIYPFVILNKSATLEEPVTLYKSVLVKEDVKIGRFSYINSGTTIFKNTTIGRFCQIGKNCEIATVDHPTNWLSCSSFQYNISEHFPKYSNFKGKDFTQAQGATIGNDVWIGSLVVVKSGVTIGDGAIIGAGSVVTKDIPPFAIAVGAPAKVIKYRFSKEIIKKLLELKWWNMDIKELEGVDFDNIELAIKELEAKNV